MNDSVKIKQEMQYATLKNLIVIEIESVGRPSTRQIEHSTGGE